MLEVAVESGMREFGPHGVARDGDWFCLMDVLLVCLRCLQTLQSGL